MRMRTMEAGRWVLCVVVAASAGAAWAEDVTQAVKDSATTARIETTFLLNEYLSPFSINTTTNNGVVTLTGSVADDVQKQLAEDLARAVDGVKEVKNNLTVVGTVVSERPHRNWRERINDATLAAAIRSRLVYNKEFKGLKIGVDVEKGVVTLFGVVGNELERQHIGQVVRETRGVERIIDNLTVHAKERTDIVTDVGRTVSDEWVEKRVQTALLFNRHLDVRELHVKVAHGLCILTGVVDSPRQSELAESLAMSIQGVGRVQNDIKIYRPPATISSPAAPSPSAVAPAPPSTAAPSAPAPAPPAPETPKPEP